MRALTQENGVISGVDFGGKHTGRVSAPLIIGVDGRSCPLAPLPGINPNHRKAVAFVQFDRGVARRRGTCSQMWLRGSEVGYVFRNDGGVTVIAYMATRDKLDGFRSNPGESLERSMTGFPDGPNLASAEPLGNALLVKDDPNLWRQPAVGNGTSTT